MTTKSRLLMSLLAAFAMVLAGLSVAGTATAAPSGADGHAVAADVQGPADCDLGSIANNATKSGSNIRGSGHIWLSGSGCSGNFTVKLHLSVLTNGVYVPVKTVNWTVSGPYDAYYSIATPCKRGQWVAHIIVQGHGKNSDDFSDTRLNVTSC
ncbi:hypothetical protein [Glycomyces sp. NPDC047010]|uniref:hypothetical protein n=1 Tax=Glycomyces sp. NPDC047010 TaxID=3155023 RepID=UPI0033DF5BF4